MQKFEQYLEIHSKTSPMAPAFTFIDEDGHSRTVNFAELQQKTKDISEKLAHYLAPGERVVILLPQGLEYIFTFIACLRARVIAVPLYPPRANQHADRVEKVVEDCHPSLILCSEDIIERLKESFPACYVCTTAEVDTCLSGRPPLAIEQDEQLKDVAFLQYTSGSTGLPKGVMVTQQNIIANLMSLQEATYCSQRDIFCNWLPLFHDLGLINTMLLPVYLGAHSVIMSPMHFMRRPLAWLNAISEYRATICGAPNFAFDYCVEKLSPEKIAHLDLSTWRIAFNAAEPIKPSTLTNFEQRFRLQGFRQEAIYPSYGMAEATVFISGPIPGLNYKVLSFDAESLEAGEAKPATENVKALKLIACGRAQSQHNIIILDAETDKILPEARVGQICFSGPSVALGYWKNAEKTSECFNIQLDNQQHTYLKTGDLGFILAGEIYVTGRMKDLMIVNGRNLYPQDFETAVQQSFDFIRSSGVVAFEHDGKCYIVAEVEKKYQDKLDYAEVVEAINREIYSAFDVFLEDIVFIRAGTLNKTSSGKVQRSKVKSGYFNQSLVGVAYARHLVGEAYTCADTPKNETELVLSEIWQDVLGIKKVGTRQSFFTLGGTSLAATQILNEIEQRLSVSLSISDILSFTKINELAQHILSTRHPKSQLQATQLIKSKLSSVQLGLLLNEEKSQCALYNLVFVFETRHPTQPEMLEKAFQVLIARHASLRTQLETNAEGDLVQCVQESVAFTLSRKSIDVQDDESGISELVHAEMAARFDFSHAPVLKATLADVEAQRQILIVVMHHLFSDGWSGNLVIAELSDIYADLVAGKSSDLPALEYTYLDFVHWQSGFFADEEFRRKSEYWQEKLKGCPPLHRLPMDYARPALRQFECRSLRKEINSNLISKIQLQAQSMDASFFSMLYAALTVFIHQFSGEKDIVFGFPAANREASEFKQVVGCFVNTLVARCQLSGTMTLRDVAGLAKSDVLASLRHQQVPFDHVVQLVSHGNPTHYNPVVQILLVQNEMTSELSLGGYACIELATPVLSDFDLTIRHHLKNGEHQLEWQYNSSLFSEATIVRFADYFELLLQLLATHIDTKISELSLLSAADQQSLAQWNSTATEYSAHSCLHHLVEQQVQLTPAAEALRFEDQSLTYRELNVQANRLARLLRNEFELKPDQLVAVCLQRSIEMVVTLLAIHKAGAGYIPLDPGLPVERALFMLMDSGAKAVVTTSELAQHFDFDNNRTLLTDADGTHEKLANQPINNLTLAEVLVEANHLAYVIYTSGSTGQPKGVMVEHQAVVNRIEWMQNQYQLSAQDRVLQKTPYSFDVSVWEFFWPLMTGATLVVAQPEKHKDAGYMMNILLQERISVLHFVPSMLSSLISVGVWQATEHLRYVFCSGEALPVSLANKFTTLTPAVALVNLYGPTEAAIDVSHYTIEGKIEQANVPIGKPIQNIQLMILDKHHNQLPVGVTGELYISGVGLARGYLNRHDLTGNSFLSNPHAKQESGAHYRRMYKTGDMARWLADGTIEYLGRNDHQVKIRGLRVELGEIEAAMLACAGVNDAVVMAGEQHEQAFLIGYFSSKHQTVTKSDLKLCLSKRLPDYMVPSVLIELEAIPLTANGKVDRKALPVLDIASLQTTYRAPVTAQEQVLAKLWQSLLNLDRVGLDDNFFALGGHSMQVMTMIAKAKAQGLQLDVTQVYNSANLSELASCCDSDVTSKEKMHTAPLFSLTEEERQALAKRIPGGDSNIQDIYPLSPLQEGILFHYTLIEEVDPYLTDITLKVKGTENLQRVLAGLDFLVSRHDILRTAIFHDNVKVPLQVVCRQAKLHRHDWTLADADSDEAYCEQLREKVARKINIADAPCMYVNISNCVGSETYFIILQLHHIIDDATSLLICFNEMVAFFEGRHHLLPPATPYKAFVAQALTHTNDAAATQFFSELLKDIEEPTFPFGLNHVQGDGATVETTRHLLPTALSERIRVISSQLHYSPAVFFHAAWALVTGLCSGQQKVVFGTVLSGRLQDIAGSDSLLGLMINTLPIRIDLGDVSIRELLAQVHSVLNNLLHYELTPLSLAQKCSPLGASTPLFSGMLNYRHPVQVAQASAVLRNLAGTDILSYEERTNYPFDLSVDNLDQDGFCLDLQVDKSIGVSRVLGYIQQVITSMLEALESDSLQPVMTLELLPPMEKAALLEGWNAADYEMPTQTRLLHEWIEVQAEKTPDAIALVHGDNQLTYAQLNQQANRLAHYLIAEQQVAPGSLVGVCAEKSVGMVVAVLATLKSGAAYVPLDPEFPAGRSESVLADTKPCIVLTTAAIAAQKPYLTGNCIYLDQLTAKLQAYSGDNLTRCMTGGTPQDLAYIVHTSGTTGKPKGIMVEHRAMAARLTGWFKMFGLAEQPVNVLQMASLAVDICLGDMLKAFASGGQLILCEKEVLLSPEALFTTIEQHDISYADFVPGVLRALTTYCQHERLMLANLRYICIGCEAWYGRDLSALRQVIGAKTRCFNLYGQTESIVDVSYFDATTASLSDGAIIPIGQPIYGTAIYIINQAAQLQPFGIMGEIAIGGPALAKGYLNQPELTASKFSGNPFHTAADSRMYRTGDYAIRHVDGTVEFVGRLDDQIKVRGYRIELGEIESVLMQVDSVIAAVAAVRIVQGNDRQVIGYYVEQGSPVSKQAIRRYLAQCLPDYMVPSFLVSLDAVPMTPSGKVDRNALPLPDMQECLTDYDPPTTATERKLCEIWQALLEVEQVGVFSNFFSLGGHSLLLTRFSITLKQEMGVTLPVKEMFERPTVAEWAELVDIEIALCTNADRQKGRSESSMEEELWIL